MLFSLPVRVATSLIICTLVSASTFTNPLKPKAGADPSIVRTVASGNEPGYYYLLNTGEKGHLEMIRSETLDGLKTGETKIVWSDKTPSRCCSLWAPEIHELDGTWYLYYTAGPADGGHKTPHVLKGGSSPWDDYHYLAELTTTFGIDGSLIHFPDYGRYFIWSCLLEVGVPISVANHQAICIAPLLSPSTIGDRSIISTPTYHWELNGLPVNEGPHALYHANKTYITFSASLCATSYYSLGLLTWLGDNPMDMKNWVKAPKPVLSSANGNIGTGHNGFFRSPDGSEIWNVFHAENQHPKGSCGGDRYTMAERVYFDDANGIPRFEQAKTLSLEQTAPSGEGMNPGLVKDPEPPQN
ncbi:hypothetical protein ACLMJK_006078 [Lecanora helva]